MLLCLQSVEVTDTAQYPTSHRMHPKAENELTPNMDKDSNVYEVLKLEHKVAYHHCPGTVCICLWHLSHKSQQEYESKHKEPNLLTPVAPASPTPVVHTGPRPFPSNLGTLTGDGEEGLDAYRVAGVPVEQPK